MAGLGKGMGMGTEEEGTAALSSFLVSSAVTEDEDVQDQVPLMSIRKAVRRIEAGERMAVADCRFVMGQPQAGREAYERGHLPGARYWDLEQDLSGPLREQGHGGRHPLPELGGLVLRLGEAGIDRQTPVLIYDDQGGAMASRMWWLLRLLGHRQAYVLDGGFSKWQEAGYPVTDAEPEPVEPRVFGSRVQFEQLIGVEDVRARLGQPGTVLIDSREAPRYRGEVEPLDRIAGHIPGAINRFWKDNLTEAGLWRSPKELALRFAEIPQDAEIIVYCGSGVTACPNVLALAIAGRADAKLYAGSWSDWISYEENPIASGDEEKA